MFSWVRPREPDTWVLGRGGSSINTLPTGSLGQVSYFSEAQRHHQWMRRMIMMRMEILPLWVAMGIKYLPKHTGSWTGDPQTSFARSHTSPPCPGAIAPSPGSTNQHRPCTSSPKSCTTVCNPVTHILYRLKRLLPKGILLWELSPQTQPSPVLHVDPNEAKQNPLILKIQN